MPFLKKKLFFLSIVSALLLVGAACDNPTFSTNAEKQSPPIQYQTVTPPSQYQPPAAPVYQPALVVPASNEGLSNNNYYTNVDGQEVHSPAYEEQPNVVPQGASAQCRDGTYSFSQHRSGTCSHHGGVNEWLN